MYFYGYEMWGSITNPVLKLCVNVYHDITHMHTTSISET